MFRQAILAETCNHGNYRIASNAHNHREVVLQYEIDIVRGDRYSRANLMPIYGDLYQIKL